MSSGTSAAKGIVTRLVQALALGVIFLLLFGASRATVGVEDRLGTIAAVGFLLLAGTLLSELLEPVGLPHLTGYLLAGIVGGPHVLHLIDHATVDRLSDVNTLALALIALAGGAELRIETVRTVMRSVSWALFLQALLGLGVMTGVFFVLAPYIPFTRELGLLPLLGVSMLWGTLAVARSPSACLGILAQTRAKGPVATFSLAFIMASDVVVVLLVALIMMLSRPLITPGGTISLDDFTVLGHHILASVAMGTTLGLLLAAYLKLVDRNFLLVLLALGFGMTEFMRYVDIDPLLSFLTAGFVVQNLSGQGEKLLHSVEQMGSVVFVVFFGTAGAHLDIPLLRSLWPIALTLCAARFAVTAATARLSSAIAGDAPTIRRWGWSSLISQAGFALGLAVMIARTFPEFGEGFRALAIAAIAINEVVGPILFKLALDRAGETDPHEAAPRPSLAPVPRPDA
jgi:Kef-type K+ transport system membrane component KefB